MAKLVSRKVRDFFQIISELYVGISPSVEMTAFEIETETETEIETEAIVISTNGEIAYE